MEAKVFLPIRLSTLVGNKVLPFAIFMHIAGKHILYCREGDNFDDERLGRLKNKKIRQLYIQEADEFTYRQYLEKQLLKLPVG